MAAIHDSRSIPTDAPDSRRRVVIIGGGLSGLVTAFELSRTPELRREYRVELYQMGHRLGGKLASSRNPAHAYRNEEHGLHVWFGFYVNTFALVREIHARWRRPSHCPFRSFEDLAQPLHHGFLGARRGAAWTFDCVDHLSNEATPGDRRLAPQTGDWFGGVATAVRRFVSRARSTNRPEPRLGTALTSLARQLGRILDSAQRRFAALDGAARLRWCRTFDERLAWLQRWCVRPLVARAAHGGWLELAYRLDFAFALCRGLLDTEDGIAIDGDLDRINDRDLRTWLLEHGCSARTTRHWPWLEGLYDASFQYIGGDRNRPSFEAGTAVRFVLRAMLTYQHAFAYLINAGMGEVLIAPLYEVLCRQGVRFHFFHRLEHLELSAGADRVRRLHFTRQARLRNGRYEPLFEHGGLRCWPTEPDWTQLQDGQRLAASGVDFESRRGPTEGAGLGEPLTLELGRDFDQVVLALPLGAIVPDADGRSACRGWLAAHPHVARSVGAFNLVPSVAAQLWLDADYRELGWTRRPAVLRSAPPYSIWCDMTPVIDHESWRGHRPRCTLYFCGAAPLRSHLGPGRDRGARARELRSTRRAMYELLEEHGVELFPGAARADRFDWNVLHDEQEREGPQRLEAQYIRINVEPSELCDVAAVGTASHRLQAHDSGVENLALAGTWIRTSINSTCVEAATMSGMAAARALGVRDRPIVGESFMGPQPDPTVLPARRYPFDPHLPVPPDPRSVVDHAYFEPLRPAP